MTATDTLEWHNELTKAGDCVTDYGAERMFHMDERAAHRSAAKAGYSHCVRKSYQFALVTDHPEHGQATVLKTEWEFGRGPSLAERIKIEDDVRLVSDVRSMSDEQFKRLNDIREKRGMHRLDRMPDGPTVQEMLAHGITWVDLRSVGSAHLLRFHPDCHPRAAA